MPERRKYARFLALKNVKLIVGNSSIINCVVRNLTSAGARLIISNAANLPEKLAITFDRGQTARQCRIVWRTMNEMGVSFIPERQR
jgi:hypothetical protein